MKEHRINGLSVNDFGEGNQPALVFIHAFPLCSRMWDPQIDEFKAKYRVIVYDLRGFGFSDVHDTHLTIDSHVEDLLSVMQSLKIDKPVLCGISMGGYIALRAMELHPDKFKAAILCDTKSEADSNQPKIARAAQINQIKSGGRSIFSENFLKNALGEIAEEDQEKKKVAARLAEILSWQKDEGITGALLTLAARTDTTEFLEKLDIPVLVIVGENDRLTPPEYSKMLYSKIRSAKLAVIQGAGHFPNMEKPEAFNKEINNFLNSLTAQK